MALNLPALPPLPPYPTGSEATQEAIVNWRELARLHTWHEELRQRERNIATITGTSADGLTAGAVAIVAELAKVLRP